MSDFNIECAIIDDEIHASDRLKDILDDFESIDILSVHNTYRNAMEVLLDTRPRVIFLDIELDKNHTAFELIEKFNSNCYFPYIILVTAFDHYSIKAIKKHVFDYLVKPIDIDELKDTLTRLQNHILSPSSDLIDNSELSNREKQVMDLVLQGKTSKEIADLLFVSKSTIDTHRKNILKKTGATSFQELFRLSHI